MIRSGFKRPVYPRPERRIASVEPGLFRLPTPSAGVVVSVPKGVKAKPGKRTPTVEEARWMQQIVEHGCVACWMDGREPVKGETAVHHILSGGRRIGHLYTIPLCDPGHHQGGASRGMVSRHPWKARFEKRYGKEMDLLAALMVELKIEGNR
jgi:hypothetical protein